jgi:hypothetical protein
VAAKPANQVRQTYEIFGGSIDFKIVTEWGLSPDELADFRKVVEAVQGYVEAHPPESWEVKAERLSAQAIEEEFE